MHCTRVGLPGNLHAIACWDRRHARACSVCGVKKTCDAPLCTSCAVHRDPDTDYCPLHARAAEGRLKL